MRDRVKRRNQKSKNPQQSDDQQQGPAPLQPTFLDREAYVSGENHPEPTGEVVQQPVYEAQPEKDPFDAEVSPEARAGRRERTRRRGRGGRGRNRTDQQQRAAQSSGTSGLPIAPGQATGEAAEIDEPESATDTPELDLPESPDSASDAATATPHKAAQPRGKKGAVVLAIGLPGSGKSSWFKLR
jgi:hypothetical protein